MYSNLYAKNTDRWSHKYLGTSYSTLTSQIFCSVGLWKEESLSLICVKVIFGPIVVFGFRWKCHVTINAKLIAIDVMADIDMNFSRI